MLRRWMGVLVVVGVVAVPATATAGHDQWVTGSVGTQLGVSNAYQLDQTQLNHVVSELQVRARFAWALGLELAYNPAAHGVDSEELVFHSSFRAAAQIYVVPLDVFSLYLTAGVGANDIGDLFAIDGGTNTYHGGAGFEIYIDDNWAVGAEYRMIVPGVRSIQKTIVEHALSSSLGGTSQTTTTDSVENLSPWDFVHPRNFETTIGARFYF